MVDDVHESERRYEQLIRTSPAPINLFDASGEIIWGNDAVVDLLALDSREQLVGRSIFEFIHADDRYTAERELVKIVTNKKPTGPTEMKLRRADGETRSIRVSTAPGRYRGDDIGQAVVIDDTALKDLQTALRTERQFTSDALNALQDVFYVIDTTGELQRWNDTLLDVSGYTTEEVWEMDLKDFFVEGDEERVSESISTTFVEGSDVLEATVVTKLGAEIPFEFRKRHLVIDGDVVGLVGTGRDVSRRKLRDQHSRAVDHLLRHNLRNQLNVILGATDGLRDVVEGNGVASVDMVGSAAEQLLSMFETHHRIVNLLTTRPDREYADIVPVIERVVRAATDAYPAATVDSGLPEAAVASALPELEQAVVELVENAVVHNDRADPHVELVVEQTASTVSLHVVDNGPPIAEMEYATLADEELLSHVSHPTGFGIWFVHLVVNGSGGNLRFERNDSAGNTVVIELPTLRTQPTA